MRFFKRGKWANRNTVETWLYVWLDAIAGRINVLCYTHERAFRGRNIVSDLTATVHFLVGYSNRTTRKWEHTRLDARRAVYHQFHQFLIAWVPTVKLDMFTRQTFGSKVQPQKSAPLGHTYHWTQLAKRMEYWQKFSFITSFSKGLIGYSLRYLGEREAAECMSGVCRLGSGSAERSAGGGAEDQANRK